MDLNFEDFIQRINSDLVGKYLNIASRSASFLKKNDNKLSENINKDLIKIAINSAPSKVFTLS